MIALNHPAQQFAPSFRLAAQSNQISLTVLYWDGLHGPYKDREFDRTIEWDVDLRGGYSSTASTGRFVQRAWVTWRTLSRIKPSVIVSFGWATPVARIAYLWSLGRPTKLLFYGDSTWQHNAHPGLRRVRAVVLRALFRPAGGALATGTFNREFYIQHGMDPAAIHAGVCPVDTGAFQAACRADLGRDEVVIGFAGKFVPRKGVTELIDALALIADRHDWCARLIGDGPSRQELTDRVARHRLSDRVVFTGFINTTHVPEALADCDVVVVPSKQDLRVLVAAEAMAAGAVVVVSSNTAVWGPGDLIEDGTTGCVYKSGDPAGLAAILRSLVADPVRRWALRSAGIERAKQFGPEAFVTTLERAVDATLQRR